MYLSLAVKCIVLAGMMILVYHNIIFYLDDDYVDDDPIYLPNENDRYTHYDKFQEIGKGGYATVYKGVYSIILTF